MIDFEGIQRESGSATSASLRFIWQQLLELKASLKRPVVWENVPFTAGDFTASASMTWTVASGDIETFAYSLTYKVINVAFNLATTTVGGTLSNRLKILIPRGLVAARPMRNTVQVFDNNVGVAGVAMVTTNGTTIDIARIDNANFAAATDLTYVYGQIWFEVL